MPGCEHTGLRRSAQRRRFRESTRQWFAPSDARRELDTHWCLEKSRASSYGSGKCSRDSRRRSLRLLRTRRRRPTARASASPRVSARRPGRSRRVRKQGVRAGRRQRGRPAPNSLALALRPAVNYRGVLHPSLPNYLALVSGSTQGITSDCTTCRVSAPTLTTTRARRQELEDVLRRVARSRLHGSLGGALREEAQPVPVLHGRRLEARSATQDRSARHLSPRCGGGRASGLQSRRSRPLARHARLLGRDRRCLGGKVPATVRTSSGCSSTRGTAFCAPRPTGSPSSERSGSAPSTSAPL